MPIIPHPHDVCFAPQADLPTQPRASAASLERCATLGTAAHAVYREVRKLNNALYAEGVRFPSPLDIVLRQLELDLDHLHLILSASNIPHWTALNDP